MCPERPGAIIRLMANRRMGDEKRRGLSLASKLFANSQDSRSLNQAGQSLSRLLHVT
jgi:hypothetical protein